MKMKRKRYKKHSLGIIIAFVLSMMLFLSLVSSIPGQGTGPDGPDTPEASLNPLTDNGYVLTTPGTTEDYILTLRNQGSQRESFVISVDSSYDWAPTIDPQTGIGLDSGDSTDITFKFQIPLDLVDGDYEFEVIVKSRGFSAATTFIHVIAFEQEIIITAKLEPILFIRPIQTKLDQLEPGDQFEFEVKVSCFIVSADVYLDWEIIDVFELDEVSENDLTFTFVDDTKYIEKGTTEVFLMTLSFSDDFDEKVKTSGAIRLKPEALGYKAYSKSLNIPFGLYHEPEENFFVTLLSTPVAVVSIASLFILGSIGAAVTSHEAGKYWLLSLLFIPLYTKLHKNKILDHFTRGRVYEYIRNNPGTHYSEIKRELELNNGSLTYHLHTLEREELVKSRTSGRFKVFYPTDVKIPKDMEPQISSIRRQILDIIREEPGITQKELGLRLPNKKQRTISYHVKNMSREGVLELQKDGRETKCFIADKVVDIKQSDQKDEKNSDEEISTQVVFRQI